LLDHFGDIPSQIVGSAEIAAEEANASLHCAIKHNLAVSSDELTLHD
jgi:hypothetical protein